VHEKPVLRVRPNADDGQESIWITYVTHPGGATHMTASVSSFAEAAERATQNGYELFVPDQACTEMATNGVGPAE
jgi:hypothetical protein